MMVWGEIQGIPYNSSMRGCHKRLMLKQTESWAGISGGSNFSHLAHLFLFHEKLIVFTDSCLIRMSAWSLLLQGKQKPFSIDPGTRDHRWLYGREEGALDSVKRSKFETWFCPVFFTQSLPQAHLQTFLSCIS